MNEIHTEIIINAPKKIIWDILTDFPAYEDWNPFIIKVMGTAERGGSVFFVARFELVLVPIFANIMEFEVGKKFSWGGPGINWLGNIFEAEHLFSIEELTPGKCRFVNRERVSGVVADAMWSMIERGKPAYVAMNEALKKRAEAANRL